VKSFSVLCTGGELGGGGRMGNSAALLTARNDSSREAVTRDAEVQSGPWRIVHDLDGDNRGVLWWLLDTNDGRRTASPWQLLHASMTVHQAQALGLGNARVRGDADVEPLTERHLRSRLRRSSSRFSPRVRTTSCPFPCLPWDSDRLHSCA
jgi:hypothetical protein